MKHDRKDEWLFAAFSAGTEIPASMEARIRESCETVRRQSRREGEKTMKKNAHKTVRTALLIAAAAAVLTVSAVAAYQYSVSDALLETPQEQDARQFISLNGLRDSPEYKAQQEWDSWLAAWDAENPDIWEELGVDDTYYETPDNYAFYYQAYFSDQAEALDAIAEKYGLTLHTARAPFYDEEQLNSLLGAGDIFSDDYEMSGEYVYEDGSCKLFFPRAGSVSAEAFLAVKGSFTSIMQSLDGDCEEWSYTTGGGMEVALASGGERSYLAAELSGAYLTVCYHGALPQTELEALAEGIDLKALDRRLAPGGDTGNIAAAVEALRAEDEAGRAVYEAKQRAVLTELGDWRAAALPEGYSWKWNDASDYTALAEQPEGWMPLKQVCQEFTCPGNAEENPPVYLTYTRCYDGTGAIANAQWLASWLEGEPAYAAEKRVSCKVGGYDAYAQMNAETTVEHEDGAYEEVFHISTLTWYDTDRELVFILSWTKNPAALEQMLTMAESITEY